MTMRDVHHSNKECLPSPLDLFIQPAFVTQTAAKLLVHIPRVEKKQNECTHKLGSGS